MHRLPSTCARTIAGAVIGYLSALCLALQAGAAVPEYLKPFGPFDRWQPDMTELTPSGDPLPAGRWRDVVGEDVFDTKGVASYRADGKLHLAFVTNFPDAKVVSADRPVSPADLALDLDGDGVLETGVVLSDIREAGDRGVSRPPHIRQGRAYRVSRWLRPSDILRRTYGAGWRVMGPGGEMLRQAEIPVWVGEGEERDDLKATVEWRDLPEAGVHVVLVTLAYPAAPEGLRYLPMLWGTAVCGNDVVFTHPAGVDPARRRPDPSFSSPTGIGPRWYGDPLPVLPPALDTGSNGPVPGFPARGRGGQSGGTPFPVFWPAIDADGGTDASATVDLALAEDSGNGGEPDDSVTAIPLPSSAWMLLSLVAAVAWLARRRLRKMQTA